VSPEAWEGGPIAALEEGDIIEINIPERRLSVDLSDEEIKSRLDKWTRPEKKFDGYLARYSALVSSAHTGAVLRV
jgi:dihydroxy-acid dehydratase